MTSVLIVDDSAFIRRVVRDVVSACSDLRVIGEAVSGEDAIAQVHALNPDVVTLDLDMPGLGGLGALGYLMSECPRPVVVLSGGDVGEGVDMTIRALELGAVDFVRKPSVGNALDLATLAERLVPALRTAAVGRAVAPVASASLVRPWRQSSLGAAARPVRTPTVGPTRWVVVIAASTGGPRALAELLPQLGASLGAAVLVAQHMPSAFTPTLATRLDEACVLRVVEATDGDQVLTGVVYIAPGGRHMEVVRGLIRLDDAPADLGVRPAADRLFASAAADYGSRVLAVVLTGMGRDGALGAQRIVASGGQLLIQDPSTCVVSGMGQAAMSTGVAHRVQTIGELAQTIMAVCAGAGD